MPARDIRVTCPHCGKQTWVRGRYNDRASSAIRSCSPETRPPRNSFTSTHGHRPLEYCFDNVDHRTLASTKLQMTRRLITHEKQSPRGTVVRRFWVARIQVNFNKKGQEKMELIIERRFEPEPGAEYSLPYRAT